MNHSHKSISGCLSCIGISPDSSPDFFHDCSSLQEEFSRIKKAYHAKILVVHPDKGGDSVQFREVQTSFEVLREIFTSQSVDSFSTNFSRAEDDRANDFYQSKWRESEDAPIPSWEYYATAAAEDLPAYRVEPAKSNRSKCTSKGAAKKCSLSPIIQKGQIRIGSVDLDTGGYRFWTHLECWRVPSKVWLGLPNPDTCIDRFLFEKAIISMNEVTICGFEDLPQVDKEAFISHIINKNNWARKSKLKSTEKSVSLPVFADKNEHKDMAEKAVVIHRKKDQFVPPSPGRDAPPDLLQGKTFVLTGTFPEIGGGAGLNLGKERVKAMIESFGGRVVSAVSGKTSVLVVGKEPGAGKVSQARNRGNKIQLVGLRELSDAIVGGRIEDAEKMAPITQFSSGYKGRALAIGADYKQYRSKKARFY